jgi:hypothetical protein
MYRGHASGPSPCIDVRAAAVNQPTPSSSAAHVIDSPSSPTAIALATSASGIYRTPRQDTISSAAVNVTITPSPRRSSDRRPLISPSVNSSTVGGGLVDGTGSGEGEAGAEDGDGSGDDGGDGDGSSDSWLR